MPGAFGQPDLGPVDLGADIGAGYQQSAANKIAQAKVKARKDFTSGFAGKYGVSDTVKATKGLSDTDIYDLATKLVSKRRGLGKPAAGAAPPKVTPKIAPKPTATKPRAAAPKVTAKTSTTKRAAATTTRTTTRRRRRRTSTPTVTKSVMPTISATKLSAITRLVT